MMCRKGCFCPAGQVRDGEDGPCIPVDQCPMECPAGETYNACGGCQGTCADQNPMCTMMCHKGCFCPAGQVRDGEDGPCIPADQCPSDVSPPQCGEDEEYNQCG